MFVKECTKEKSSVEGTVCQKAEKELLNTCAPIRAYADASGLRLMRRARVLHPHLCRATPTSQNRESVPHTRSVND